MVLTLIWTQRIVAEREKKKAERGEAKLQVINGPFTPLHHPSSPNPKVPIEVVAFFEVSRIKE